jgi:hypothetical protein
MLTKTRKRRERHQTWYKSKRHQLLKSYLKIELQDFTSELLVALHVWYFDMCGSLTCGTVGGGAFNTKSIQQCTHEFVKIQRIYCFRIHFSRIQVSSFDLEVVT